MFLNGMKNHERFYRIKELKRHEQIDNIDCAENPQRPYLV